MKTILLIISFAVVSTFSFGQRPDNGATVTRPNLDKFIGTWKYSEAGKEVTIILKKAPYRFGFPDTYHWDDEILMGVHQYKLNGVVVEDYLAELPLLVPSNTGTVDGSTMIFSTDLNKIKGSYEDRAKHKRGDLLLTYIPGTPAKLIWRVDNPEHHRIGVVGQPLPPYDQTFTLPINMVFTKQP